MPQMLRIVTAVLLFVGAPLTAAEDEARVDYTGHQVVQVLLADEADLDAMLAISNDCWCEAVGLGVRNFRVSPDGMAKLEQSGIAFEVVIPDLGPMIEAERNRLEDAPAGLAGAWFTDFKDFAAIEARLNLLVTAHPGIATLEDIGDSIEGRDIWAVTISSGGSGKPGILFNGTQHAREWISPMVNMYILETLLEGYGSDPVITGLIDTVDFHIVPVVNPDGYVYSWGPDRLWRKNRRDNGDGTFGVDTNRNWGLGWGGGGSSGDTSDLTYRGTAPFSEPETQALRDYYLARPDITASIDFHSFSQLVLYPFAFQEGGPGDSGEHELLGDIMSDAIFDVHGSVYVPGPVFETLYQASGGSVDWTWGVQGVISYTVELRDTGAFGFLLPPEQIIPTAEENFPGIVALAEGAGTGVTFIYPNGRPDVIEADTPTTVPVGISALAGDLNPSSGLLWTRVDGGAYSSSPLTSLGNDQYEAELPGTPCGSTLEWYVEIVSFFGATYTSPMVAPDAMFAASSTQTQLAFADDFEGDAGWTVTNVDLQDGGWERGVPAGGGDRQDPPVDFDGSGSCYLTDNVDGNSDVDGGPTRLFSPIIDATSLDDPRLRFAWWFSNNNNDGDRLDVAISNDGGANWTPILSAAPAGGWQTFDELVSDFIAPTSTMQLRFDATDNPNDSVTEAGVDAVRFYESGCPDVGDPCVGDVDGDGSVAFGDLLGVLSAWGPCPGCPEDVDGDDVVGFNDILTVLSAWGPCP